MLIEKWKGRGTVNYGNNFFERCGSVWGKEVGRRKRRHLEDAKRTRNEIIENVTMIGAWNVDPLLLEGEGEWRKKREVHIDKRSWELRFQNDFLRFADDRQLLSHFLSMSEYDTTLYRNFLWVLNRSWLWGYLSFANQLDDSFLKLNGRPETIQPWNNPNVDDRKIIKYISRNWREGWSNQITNILRSMPSLNPSQFPFLHPKSFPFDLITPFEFYFLFQLIFKLTKFTQK
jgi:hypothetical protein